MKGLQKLRKNRKSGMSLVEMIVILLVFGIMMTRSEEHTSELQSP